MYKVVILLTACVNPNGMQQTALQDVNSRLQQYKEALNYYLKVTCVPIIFVENTGTDFSGEYANYIEKGRLEYFTFNGNNYDRRLGKGYGESLIINYAFNVSTFLRQTKYVLKVTGRLKVKNINSLVNIHYTSLSNIFRSTFYENRFVKTTVFLIETKTLEKFVKTEGYKCDDSTGHFFEYMLHDFLAREGDVFFLPYIIHPKIEGVSGTHNKPYYLPSIKENLYNSLNGTFFFYKCSKNHIMRLIFGLVSKLYNVSYMCCNKEQRKDNVI